MCDGSLGTHEFCAFNFILKIGCDTSQEATEQFGQAMEVKEAFLGCWSRLRLDFLAFAFGYAGVVVLPSNMVDVGGVFGCRGMLQAFVRYPPATSYAD